MKTIILRFSDAEREGSTVSTVDAHTAIIAAQGSTWWGWWKKEHEAFRLELLEQIEGYSRSRPVRIGLVNRKVTERLFFAECTGCVFSRDNPVLSPEAKLTPSYYANDRFPAWFKLSKIWVVSRDDFVREFGDVPSLDATLYEVINDGSERRVIPSRTWNLDRIEAKGEAILHISDLHFGEGHGFPLNKEVGRGLELSPLIDVLIRSIREHTKVPIGAVVASGDFVSKGDANAYPDAAEFLRELLKRLHLDSQYCVVVPGNHDLWTMNVEHPTRTYGHEKPYRSFVREFYLEEIQDLERITRIALTNNVDLIFVSLNSARIRNDKFKEYGYVSKHRYDELLKYLHRSLLADHSGKTTLLFAVLHHHIVSVTRVDIPDGEKPISLTLDAGELIEGFCKSHVGYILHGHQHVPFVGSVSRMNLAKQAVRAWEASKGNLFVLGCGTTGAKQGWLSNEFQKNSFSIYIPRDDHLDVSVFQFSPSEGASLYWNGAIPLQNFHKMAALEFD
jgi:predicted MPP superfamily phosphohydrolase